MAEVDENFLDLLEIPGQELNVTDFNPEYTMLNDRSSKSSSDVWKHFGTLKYNELIDRKHVYCIQCFEVQKIKKYQRSTSTGNLSKHLKSSHGISLIQPYRIKREADDSIVSIVPEQINGDIPDMKTLNKSIDDNEYIVCDLNEILIGEVAKRPALYNSSAATQQQKGQKHQTRRQLWSQIHNSMHQTIPLARLPKIWKNIRDRYYKVRRSVETSTDSGYKPRYRYYDMLRFLDDVKIEKLKEETNDGDTYALYFEGESEPGSESLDESDADKFEQSTVEGMETEVSASLPAVQKPEPAKQPNIYELKANPPDEKTESAPKQADEFDDFGNFVAKVMRKMTKPQSRKLQVNILNLISEIEDE